MTDQTATGNTAGQPADDREGVDPEKLSSRDWGEAYEIAVDAGTWSMRRRDGIGGVVTASSPDELQKLITEDHAFRPVRVMWRDNVAHRREFEADHPGTEISWVQPDRWSLVTWTGVLPGREPVTAHDLGHLLDKLEALAADEAI
jgi:hypothetical protein